MRRDINRSNGTLKKCPSCMKALKEQKSIFKQEEDGVNSYVGMGFVQEKLLKRLKTTQPSELHRLYFNKLHKHHSYKFSHDKKPNSQRIEIEL